MVGGHQPMKNLLIAALIQTGLIILGLVFIPMITLYTFAIIGFLALLIFFSDALWCIWDYLYMYWYKIYDFFYRNPKCIIIGLLLSISLSSNAQLYLGLTRNEIIGRNEVIRYENSEAGGLILYWASIKVGAVFNDYGLCTSTVIDCSGSIEKAREIARDGGTYISPYCYKHYDRIAYYIYVEETNGSYYLIESLYKP